MRRETAIGAAILAFLAPPALAHGPGPVSPDDVWTHWSLDPWIVGPLLLASWLYGRGAFGLWRRLGRRTPALGLRHAAAFMAGEAALLVALVSPLDELSGTLLSAHMVQHVIIVAVAPPLMLLGKPEVAWLKGVPPAWRRWLARAGSLRRFIRAMAPLARPLPAAGLHAAVLWAWHAPGPFQAAGSSEALHVLEHALFFGTALLFWRGLLRASSPELAAAGAAAAFLTMLQGGFLGALIGLSGTPLYPAASRWAFLWGLSPQGDQHLAGAIMWVPAGTVYLAAGLWMASRLLAVPRPVWSPAGRGWPEKSR